MSNEVIEPPAIVAEPPVIVQNQNEQAPAKPPMWRVMLHNDASTMPHFVVMVLNQVFIISRERAMQIMMKAHTDGRALVEVYAQDVAETRVDQAMKMVAGTPGMNGRSDAPCELTFTAEPETAGD